jgi:hypothetical protein
VTTKSTKRCQLALRPSLHPLLGFCIFGSSSLVATFRDKQIHRRWVVPFFAHHTGALTEGFDRNVAGAGNLLNRQPGRYVCQPRILHRLEVERPVEAVTKSVPRCAHRTSRPPGLRFSMIFPGCKVNARVWGTARTSLLPVA